jgi:hypothetical protein
MKGRLWKVYCEEDRCPGMWQRWFVNQCVAVGWAGKWGYQLTGDRATKRGSWARYNSEYVGWSGVRWALDEIKPGDLVVVALKGHRVGRIGEVTGKAVGDDDWDPLVPRSRDEPDGEIGRRVFVRWELETGPDDRKLVVALPDGDRLPPGKLRRAIAELDPRCLPRLRRAMNEASNWVGLSEFPYEKALSDYIGAYPHLLEDGLLPHPNKRVRERVFRDRSRLDVLLEDRDQKAVIVECKQRQPTANNVRQLQRYLRRFRREERQDARGILVQGGARKLRDQVRRAARRKPVVELVQFTVGVSFFRSG